MHLDGSKLNLELAFGQNFGASVVSPVYAAGVPVIGRIDAISTSDFYLDEHGEERYMDGVEVIDWKTTGQVLDVVDEVTGVVTWKGRAKTAAQIASSWQMLAYGEEARRIYDPKEVRLSHVYFQTKRPYSSVKRTSSLSPAVLVDRWAAADELVGRMLVTAGEASVKSVPANLRACKEFGGCPYRDSCPRDARAVFSNLFGGDRVSILERRRAQAVQNSPVRKPRRYNTCPASRRNPGVPLPRPPAAPSPTRYRRGAVRCRACSARCRRPRPS